jgi:neutral ceramidase
MGSRRTRPDRPTRRVLLEAGAGAVLAAAHWPRVGRSSAPADGLLVGAAAVDATPPVGIELAGFHRPPENPRLVTGSRQAAATRAIVVSHGDVRAAIVVLDILAVSAGFAREFARAVEQRVGIPADHVRLCATHTHSMPTFIPLRQWGAVSEDYRKRVIAEGVEAVVKAWHDRTPARLLVGSSRVAGASFNRTMKGGTWRTDAEFGPGSDESDRWLDTMLHAVVFERSGGKPPILAYHFSCHPVCFNDTLSGPDWPGLVADHCRATRGVEPVYLQGHSGDVNPGDGTKSIGDVEPTARAVSAGLSRALDAAREVAVERVTSARHPLELPLDLETHARWLETYRTDPGSCNRGRWVDAGFAADWFAAASAAAAPRATLPTTVSCLRLGPVAIVFHPAELYSVYGLVIRRDSGVETTLAVGYTDDFVGYLTDPAAYRRNEYAAVTVPKLLDLPPFTPTAADGLVAAAKALVAATE